MGMMKLGVAVEKVEDVNPSLNQRIPLLFNNAQKCFLLAPSGALIAIPTYY